MSRASKKRNVKGRKNPAFADAVILMFRDSLVTLDEMMEKKPNKEIDEKSGRLVARYNELPDNCTVVDSLNGHTLFKDERLFRHIDRIALALSEFGDEFLSDEGVSVRCLRVDKKNRVWGNEVAVLALAYLAIGAGLAEWSEPRSEWFKNEDNMQKIKFLKKEQEHEQQDSITREDVSEETRRPESTLS
jgi:hypothetical protein